MAVHLKGLVEGVMKKKVGTPVGRSERAEVHGQAVDGDLSL